MSGGSGIEWTDVTWNPLTGCTAVSPGCDHCYAKTMHERFHRAGSFETVTLHPQRLGQPARWRSPRRVFVNSMSDLFHASVPTDFIAEVFAVMACTPQHTYQLLTKRHARIRSLLNDPDFKTQVWGSAGYGSSLEEFQIGGRAWPLPNVWVGVSVETQTWADIRVPCLLDTPAAVRWISAEPLLGPLTLRLNGWLTHHRTTPGLDWVVAGGESGAQARPMSAAWARALRDECHTAGTAFFFKQWGAHDPTTGRRVGKKTAGRVLDGRTWDQYPRTRATLRKDALA